MVATHSYLSCGSLEQQTSLPRSLGHTQRESLAAFNELVLEHQDAVFQQALWIMGDEDAAEDAAQEAFIRAYRNLHSYNGGPFRPWILRITTNYCLDQLRRRKTHPTISLEVFDEYNEEIENPVWLKDPSASVEDTIERSELQARIVKGLNRLSPENRAAVILVDVQGLDYMEAAEAADVPLGTFKSRLSRGRAQLQKLLANERKFRPHMN